MTIALLYSCYGRATVVVEAADAAVLDADRDRGVVVGVLYGHDAQPDRTGAICRNNRGHDDDICCEYNFSDADIHIDRTGSR